MINRLIPIVLLATSLVGAVLPSQANPITREEVCRNAIEQTQNLFASYEGGVPSSVAAAGANVVFAACYETNSTTGSSLEVTTNLNGEESSILDTSKLCSGGGATVMGWANFISVAGKRFHIDNGPASSYVTWYKDGGKTFVVGHARSMLDNMEFAKIGTEPVAYWDFAHIPMSGAISVKSQCLGPLVTSTTFDGQGFPLAIPIMEMVLDSSLDEAGILFVQSTGTTCLIPC
jgi:hypothetical protein